MARDKYRVAVGVKDANETLGLRLEVTLDSEAWREPVGADGHAGQGLAAEALHATQPRSDT